MMMRKGMGEYPGYYCYDANRPSWLPYWLDDAAESTCKYNPATIAGNITACANPLATNCAQDSLINANVAQGVINPDPTISGPGVAAAGDVTNAPTSATLPGGLTVPTTGYTWVMYAVAAIAGVYLIGQYLESR